MVVKFDAIREEGLKLDEPLSPELFSDVFLKDATPAGFHSAGSARLRADLRRVRRDVLLKAQIDLPLEAPCKRCLGEVTLRLPISFTLNLVPKDKVLPASPNRGGDDAGEKAGSFDLKSADEEVFDGRTIDLDPIVREQVLLALPMNVLCKDDCAGLCPQCGQNLNDTRCDCGTKTVDSQLQMLKGIKLN